MSQTGLVGFLPTGGTPPFGTSEMNRTQSVLFCSRDIGHLDLIRWPHIGDYATNASALHGCVGCPSPKPIAYSWSYLAEYDIQVSLGLAPQRDERAIGVCNHRRKQAAGISDVGAWFAGEPGPGAAMRRVDRDAEQQLVPAD
jgi:hypothetical protein